MKLRLFTVANGAIVDARTNRTTLIGIIDEIHSKQYPAILQDLHIVSSWERDTNEEDPSCRVEIHCGDEKLIEGTMLVQFQGAQITRSFIHLDALVVPRNESLKFLLFISDELAGTWHVIADLLDDESQN